ncbi:hypothetical protein Tsubulata_032612 [Turnera subulata]|uniref:Uncharacterized protein n=1 Tax=Turnera subulata TaxID=218843 RepID=A0A9Q0F3N4_9ROSI|nr:hypothetical protein Tsubulata_032612 [Turnera subulata]
MSLAADSPVHSSSSDDFAAFRDGERSSASSAREEALGEDGLRIRMLLVHPRKKMRMKVTLRARGPLRDGNCGFNRLKRPRMEQLEVAKCFEESATDESLVHNSGKGLGLGNDGIARLCNTDMNLLRHKKLYLVLDLDHTLLHSTQLIHMTPEEEYLRSQPDSLQGTTALLSACA